MFGYELVQLRQTAEISTFQTMMAGAGLVAPAEDFLAAANVFGLRCNGQMVGGFVQAQTPKRVFLVLSAEAAISARNQMEEWGIGQGSVQELSSLWASRSVGFIGRFILMIASLAVTVRAGAPHIMLMCRKAGLTRMYENGRPLSLYREPEGSPVERVYLFSKWSLLRALAKYPGLKLARALKKAYFLPAQKSARFSSSMLG